MGVSTIVDAFPTGTDYLIEARLHVFSGGHYDVMEGGQVSWISNITAELNLNSL